MRSLVRFIALFVVAVGVFGLVAPRGLVTAVGALVTPLGLYAVAALRVLFGIGLLLAAPPSRAPRVLRVLGIVILVAGIITPFFGVERSRAIVDWWSTQGTAFMRVLGGLAVVFGAFVMYALVPRHGAG